MSFGEAAFSGSRFIFWCLAPVLLACAVGLPLMLTEWTPTKVIVTIGWSSACILAIPALYDSRRFWWAARALTFIIFASYAEYLVYEMFSSGKGFGPTRRSEASPWNSVWGFVIIGFPALWYTIFGRFSLRAPPNDEEDQEHGSDS